MTMLIIVFRQTLDEEIANLMRELKVHSFTEVPNILGLGESGRVGGCLQEPGFNSLILSALKNDLADTVVEKLRHLRDELSHRQHGAKIPIHVFAVPCDQVM